MSTHVDMHLRTKAARTTFRVLRAGVGPNSLRARVDALEREVQENRALNRRIAELTDVVAELLVRLYDRDESKVEEILADYRKKI